MNNEWLAYHDSTRDNPPSETAVRAAQQFGELPGLVMDFCVLKWEMHTFLLLGITFVTLAAVFGAWFTFWAKEKLPPYYDEYKISAYVDGGFQMSFPGVNFNNRNWPHIVKTGWLWSVLVLVLCPLCFFLVGFLFPGGIWVVFGVSMTVFFCSMFVPFYVVAIKYK